MHEIALLTYHEKYVQDVVKILEKRLNDKGKNWRHIMKALTIVLYCLYEGSDLFLSWLRSKAYLIATLRTFRHVDSRNIDHGGPIRTKSMALTELLENDEKLAKEKENYRLIRAQMGKPGILDLNSPRPHNPEFRPSQDFGSSSRLTLDLSSLGRPETSSEAPSPRRSGPVSEGRYSLSVSRQLHPIEEGNELVQIASREVLEMQPSFSLVN